MEVRYNVTLQGHLESLSLTYTHTHAQGERKRERERLQLVVLEVYECYEFKSLNSLVCAFFSPKFL